MPSLHQMLDEREGRLHCGWVQCVSREVEDSSAADEAAGGGVATFLAQLRSALQAGAGVSPQPIDREPTRAGVPEVSIDPVVATRAFGLLHAIILEVAVERGVAVSLAEQSLLASQVNAAIGRAALGQSRRHERDLHHFAHKLRNPRGSALMALTLLRSRVDVGESARLAEMAERNLQKLQRVIDDAVDKGATVPSPGAEPRG
jgi:signal transduction histidine kinase